MMMSLIMSRFVQNYSKNCKNRSILKIKIMSVKKKDFQDLFSAFGR